MSKRIQSFLIITLLFIGGGLAGCEKAVNYVNQNCSGSDGSFSCGSGNGGND